MEHTNPHKPTSFTYPFWFQSRAEMSNPSSTHVTIWRKEIYKMWKQNWFFKLRFNIKVYNWGLTFFPWSVPSSSYLLSTSVKDFHYWWCLQSTVRHYVRSRTWDKKVKGYSSTIGLRNVSRKGKGAKYWQIRFKIISTNLWKKHPTY